MARFYGHFAAAYGTFWIVLMAAALISQSHIDAGAFGMFGFPVIALIYAGVRMAGDGDTRHHRKAVQDYRRYSGRDDY